MQETKSVGVPLVYSELLSYKYYHIAMVTSELLSDECFDIIQQCLFPKDTGTIVPKNTADLILRYSHIFIRCLTHVLINEAVHTSTHTST